MSADENNPLRNFTILGRLWIIACIVLGMLGFYAYVTDMLPNLPSGSYPVIIFILPVAIATFLVYVFGYLLMGLCGFRLRKAPTDDAKP
jgi:hypothetical protein